MILFQNAFMFFESSFEILLFPNELIIKENKKITSYNKAHITIFKMAIETIQKMIDFVIFTQTNNLFPNQNSESSKYITNSKIFKAIDIVELGFALYHSHYFLNRTGEFPVLYDFIENLGRYFGVEILNVRHRISELRDRAKKQVIFLEQLVNIYTHHIKQKLNNTDNQYVAK